MLPEAVRDRTLWSPVVLLGAVAQRHVAAVDLGPDRLRAEIGMDGKGEIDRGRTLG